MRISHALGLAALLCSLAIGLSAQTHMVELTASDGGPNDGFGGSVAVQGSTLVVGAQYAPNFITQKHSGAAYVFVDSGNAWNQVAKLTASDGGYDNFGSGVAINGNTIVVGGPGVGGSAVYVLRQTSKWLEGHDGNRKVDDVHPDFHGLGLRVAISGDGNKIVSESSVYGVFVFVKPPSGWTNTTQASAAILPPPGAQGFAGSLSMSGDTVVVCSSIGGAGAAYVYNLNQNLQGSFYLNPISTLKPSDANFANDYWLSVAIDGSTIVAGAVNHDSIGAAYVFVEPPSGWVDMTQTAELSVANSPPMISFGDAVAVSGKTIVVGAPRALVGQEIYQGAFFGYEESPTGWVDSLTPNLSRTSFDGVAGDFVGWSVAIDGKVLVVGGPNHAVNGNQYQGAVYVLGPQ